MNLILLSKNARYYNRRQGKSQNLKRKIIMQINLISLFLLLALMQVYATAHSQITLHEKDATLESILKSIEKQSGYVFFYDDKDLKDVRASVNVNNVSIEAALFESLKNKDLTFKIDQKDVLIKKKILYISTIVSLNTGKVQEGKQNFTIKGRVYEKNASGAKVSLPYASVAINAYGISTATDRDGEFNLARVPQGNINLTIKHLGKITIDTTLNVTRDLNLEFTLQEADFRLADVSVTAESRSDKLATSSLISRTAIDHLQANNLADVMSLLPGGKATNPELTNAKYVTIRSVGTGNEALNAFGTSIVINGAPVSNNANLQTMSPVVSGGAAALAGGAAANSGFDVRTISMDNVESVEVISGIPSVEYGDVTSGVININMKAGIQPLRINAKTNPNIYQISATSGTDFGGNKGALNLGVDYAYNTNNPVQSYQTYQRFNGNALYSNSFFGNRLLSTTSIDLDYGKSTRKLNPDDEKTKTSSSGRDLGLSFNTRGTLSFSNSWIRTLSYTAKTGYTDKNSKYGTLYTSATSPYSMTLTDGAILSNHPNTPIYDVGGNELTNIRDFDRNRYAIYLPDTYMGYYDILGKEFNTYLKTSASFFNKIGETNHRWIVGADYKFDQNLGKGKVFSDTEPPYRNLSSVNASFRPRSYKDIPGIGQLGLFVEENLSATIGKHAINFVGGLRYDRFTGNKDVLSPRLNASIDIVPKIFKLTGGYGQLAKSPSTLYLYPENAYFEYVNINEMASVLPDPVYMTTTHVFSTENPDLEIAKNEKMELGFELNIQKTKLKVTAFKEKMNNGYALDNTVNSFIPLTYNEYKRTGDGSLPIFELDQSNPVLAKFYMPTNSRVINKDGVEFTLDLGRFESIRSSFVLNGAWTQNESYSNDYTYFDANSTTGGAGRSHIGLYEPGMAKRKDQYAVTSLRSTHNIPQIGFVVTLTTQVSWIESDWTNYTNDRIPVKYISIHDGLVHDFDPAKVSDPEFVKLIRSVNERVYIKESYPPLFVFNLNLTKEIADYMRVSFFANNMFRSYPLAESKRNLGTYERRNNNMFFGLELSLTLK